MSLYYSVQTYTSHRRRVFFFFDIEIERSFSLSSFIIHANSFHFLGKIRVFIEIFFFLELFFALCIHTVGYFLRKKLETFFFFRKFSWNMQLDWENELCAFSFEATMQKRWIWFWTFLRDIYLLKKKCNSTERICNFEWKNVEVLKNCK